MSDEKIFKSGFVNIIGNPNVGKSTLMNLLGKADVFAENKLFATLDTTVRKVVIGTMPFLLSDTVGFIRKLPHHLVESFKSTLDETKESDVILHIVDIAHPQFEDQIKTVNATLKDLGVDQKPTLMIFNKIDLYRERYFDEYLDKNTKEEILSELQERLKNTYTHDNVFVSAYDKENIEQLKDKIAELVTIEYSIKYPFKSKAW